MPSLLLLTNPLNGSEAEDRYLADFLSGFFAVTLADPLKSETWTHDADGILMRNIWPTHQHYDAFESLKNRLRATHTHVYNPLVGKGDMQGKEYLVELWRQHYPVIPSVTDVKSIDLLPASDAYFLKPFHGCDGYGSKTCSMKELRASAIMNFVIQPRLTI